MDVPSLMQAWEQVLWTPHDFVDVDAHPETGWDADDFSSDERHRLIRTLRQLVDAVTAAIHELEYTDDE
jgi:hypothetical protein